MSSATLSVPAPAPTRRRVGRSRPAGWARARVQLALLAVVQTALAYRPGSNRRPFIDEGLYVYMGHRMIDHLLHGVFLQEYPGSYFSGAPGFYPVLAALADSVGGLEGARAVSLLGAIASTVCVFGLSRSLFGQPAGSVAAASFVVCGSVIYQSHLAVYDSTMMALVAGAAWLTVSSVQRDELAWAPVIGGLLTLAFFAKYAGAVYAPVVAGLAVAVGWRRLRWLVVRRAAFLLTSAVVMVLFVMVLWGNSLWPGLMSTTVHRSAIFPATRGQLLRQAGSWVGPWIALALVGAAFRVRRDGLLVLVLLTGSIVGVAQQIRIEDATSMNKHLAFGLVFACPLIGDLAARALRRARRVTVPAVALALLLLLASGLHLSGIWLSGWIQDDTLLPPLRAAIALNPGKAILAEEGAPERYALRREIDPAQYGDTYSLVYSGLTGDAAYRKAIADTHYGVIYLSATTQRGRWLRDYLSTGRTPYRRSGAAARMLHGKRVGTWLIFTPKVSAQLRQK